MVFVLPRATYEFLSPLTLFTQLIHSPCVYPGPNQVSTLHYTVQINCHALCALKTLKKSCPLKRGKDGGVEVSTILTP
jgi:hypothetical protein